MLESNTTRPFPAQHDQQVGFPRSAWLAMRLVRSEYAGMGDIKIADNNMLLAFRKAMIEIMNVM